MLSLVLGREGSGKSERLYHTAAAKAARGTERQIFLVPETFSHIAERKLCEIGGDSISLYCEVLTFRRLADRVFAECGGLADKVLDDGGRILLMRGAMTAVRQNLIHYTGDPGEELLQALVKIVDEFKSCRVSDNDIDKAIRHCGTVLSGKLRDLKYIRAAYDILLGTSFSDPRDEIERLEPLIRECRWFDGRDIYIDGFSGFTPQELAVVQDMDRARVTVAFTCDGLDARPGDLFEKSASTANKLIELLGGKDTQIINTDPPERSPDLAFLEQNLFGYGRAEYADNCEHIKLHEADGMYTECEYAASAALKLMRDGMRCRDICVVCGDFDGYRAALEAAFERFGVPYYTARKTDLRSKSATAIVLRALDIASEGFTHDNIFSYLKTGLAGLSPDEYGILENYCLMWRVRPFQWTGKAKWGMNPDGMGVSFTDDGKARLSELNSLRQRAAEPLLKLCSSLKKQNGAKDKVKALYDFTIAVDLPGSIEKRSSELESAGNLTDADEFRQLWDVLCRAMDSFCDVLGDTPLSVREFSSLFKLVLTGYDIGSVPPSVDRVAMGDFSRLRVGNAEAVIAVGAVDGSLPPSPASGGLLSDSDRDFLADEGFPLSFTSASLSADAIEDVYISFSKARRLLAVSWPSAAADGSQLRPSHLVRRLQSMFPEIQITRGERDGEYMLQSASACFDLALAHDSEIGKAAYNALITDGEWKQALLKAQKLASMPCEPLGRELARGLYGKKLNLSSSRVDSFNYCRFGYYAKYGLKLNKRREAGFDAPQTGLFVHYVLEGTVRDVSSAGGFGECTRDQVREFARAHTIKYLNEYIPDFDTRPRRFRYLFAKLQRALDVMLENMRQEFAVSSFVPLDFELDFSSDLPPVNIPLGGPERAVLRGTADRVDGWVRDGILYLRVMDYKSGGKDFSYGEIKCGIGMQMPVYLFALHSDTDKYLARHPNIPADAIVPAGVLYLPVFSKTITADHDLPDNELADRLDGKLRRSGVVLDDDGVLDAMEKSPDGNYRFLPVKLGRSRTTGLADSEDFRLLERHISKMLKSTGQMMLAGNIGISPSRSAHLACEYCEFKPLCCFEPVLHSEDIRRIPSMNGDEFFKSLKNEEAEE